MIKLKYTVGVSAYANGRACVDDNGYVYDTAYPGNSFNAIGYIDSDGFVYPTARLTSHHDAVGKVNFSTWEVRTIVSGTGLSLGPVIGKGDPNGEVYAKNVFGPVGYAEPADPRGAAAILLLLQAVPTDVVGTSQNTASTAHISNSSTATGSNSAPNSASAGGDIIGIICCAAIVILGILLKTKLFILGGLAFILIMLVFNLQREKRIDLHSVSSQVLFVDVFLGCFWGITSYIIGMWLVILAAGVLAQGSVGALNALEDGGYVHLGIMSTFIGLGVVLDMLFNPRTDKKEINMNTLTAGYFILLLAAAGLCIRLQVSIGLTVVIILALFVVFLGGLFFIKYKK